jgi:UDP-N-acetylglucosamine 2-epimerase (non-hydrolysing)
VNVSQTGNSPRETREDALAQPDPREEGHNGSKVLCVFGTRPEVIKLAPIIRELKLSQSHTQVLTVCSGQHSNLLDPLFGLFNFQVDFDLAIMRPEQNPNEVCARVLSGLGPIFRKEIPDLIVVQGDTTTALAGAMAGFHYNIPVAHVEAGLRSGNPNSPFPEEVNRRVISRLAKYHFAATPGNRETLLQEGVPEPDIFVTGNPGVDSLYSILENTTPSERVRSLLVQISSRKLLVLTTHRRESFGETMRQNLRTLRRFVETHNDVSLVFAVHPNPNVVRAANRELDGHERILLIEPLGYADFIHLLRHAWLLVSDSGGIQEEAPSLGKPLLVLRNNTERPEAIKAGTAVLVGDHPGRLASLLNTFYEDPAWVERVKQIPNPFGDGKAGPRIADLIVRICDTHARTARATP